MKKLNIKYISEVIKDEHITKWKNGDVVLFEAQVGAGKTTFTVNDLLHLTFGYLQVLYICNRRKLSRDIKIDLLKKFKEPIPMLENGEINFDELDQRKKFKNVTVTTYQAIAKKVVFNPNYDLSRYKYIINDECHFFISDASWNNETDLTFKKLIREEYPRSIRIFASATMDEIKGTIVKANTGTLYEYDTGRDFSYLDVKYFQRDDDIIQLIKNNEKTDDKWVIFVKSVAQGDKIKKKLLKLGIDVVFVHAKSRNDPIVNEKFKEKVLLATKIYDNGINIWDDQVKHVVVNANDRTTFIQEIGRVRIDIHNARQINLFIPKTYPKTWRSYINTVYTPKVEQYNLYKKDYELFKKKYSKRFKDVAEDIFFLDDGNWKVNILGLWRLDRDLRNAQELTDDLENNDSFQFVMDQLGWLGLEQTFEKYKLIKDVVDNQKVDSLDKYLDSIVGNVMLTAKDRTELIEAINVRDGKNNRLLKGLDLLNGYLKEINLNYFIKEFETCRRIDGKKKKFKSTWKVMRLVDE